MKKILPFLWLLAAGCGKPADTPSGDDTGAESAASTFGGVRFQQVVNFGTVAPDIVATATVSLANASRDDVSLSNAFTNGRGFDLQTDLDFPVTLKPNDAVSVSVVFEPTEPGDYEGTLNIGVAGEVGYGEITLLGIASTSSGSDSGQPSGNGQLQITPEVISFGSAGLTDVIWRSVEITNIGGDGFLLRSISTSDPTVFLSEPAFELPKLLNPSSTATLEVGFSPTEVRDYTGFIDIETETDSGGVLIPVSGTGSESSCDPCAPVMTVYTSSGSSDSLDLSPSGLGCSARGTVTVSNSGDVSLDLTDATVINDAISTCGNFALSWPGPTTITPGSSTELVVDYFATESCTDFAFPEFDINVLKISGSDPNTPEHTVGLSGTALFCG